MTAITVKARSRQGTKSLDLTIPTKIVEETKLKEGDIFVVEKIVKGGNITLTYNLVYKQ